MDTQPPAVRRYLLTTSILNRFSAPLCDALWMPDSERGEGVIDGAAFIACFSPEFVERSRTYMHEELAIAIGELRMRPADATWFNCDITAVWEDEPAQQEAVREEVSQ